MPADVSVDALATILPFPPRADRPATSLALAVRRLEQALADQRAAICAWRAGLAELQAATGCLQGTLGDHAKTLGELAGQAHRLSDVS